MKSKDELKSFFENGDIPKQEDFWEWQDSYWHKDEKLPANAVDLSAKADLVGGKVPASQLPSYVDDVIEFDSFENLPSTGEKGKIYIVTDTNNQYRWSGSEYIQINSGDTSEFSNLKVSGNGIVKHNLLSGDAFSFRNTSAWASSTNKPGGLNGAVVNFTPYNLSGSTYGYSLGARNNKLYFATEENSVFGIWNEVYHSGNTGSAPFVPYTGATNNIDLNAKSINNATSIIGTDITASKIGGGNVNIGTGTSAGSTAAPKYMNLNFLGYSNTIKAKISSSDIGSNSVLSPLIFYTYAQTGLQESMRIDGSGTVKIQNLAGTGDRMVVAAPNGTLSTHTIPTSGAYTSSNGVLLTDTNFTPVYGTTANTIAQGNDLRINNGQTAFEWGNHAAAGYASTTFVQESINDITLEITDPDYLINVKNKFVTIIITDNFALEKINWEQFYPEQSVTVINTGSGIITLELQGKAFDKIDTRETSEYYINKNIQLIKKGNYKETAILA